MQIVAPAAILAGQQFSIDAKVSLVQNLVGTPFVLTYDPASVDFVSAVEGSFLKQDGKSTIFSVSPDPEGGTVTVTMLRPAGSKGVSGTGTLATFTFRAKKQGQANFGFSNVNFVTADGAPFDVVPFVKPVAIQ